LVLQEQESFCFYLDPVPLSAVSFAALRFAKGCRCNRGYKDGWFVIAMDEAISPLKVISHLRRSLNNSSYFSGRSAPGR
jgi:hypothetical protein